MLEINNIHKSFGNLKVLKGVTLNVKKGEVVCLLGDNGEGKSTLLNIIATTSVQKDGTIRINGKSVDDDLLGYKKELGYVPDSFKIFEYLTVIEYIGFVLSMYDARVDKSKISKLIESINLNKEVNKQIKALSKGNRKKVLILTSFLHNPSVVIMDEPLDGLDLGVRKEMKKIIKEIGRSKSVLISTHEVDVINDLADKIAILSNGVIKEFDTVENLKLKYGLSDIEDLYNEVRK